MKTTLEKLKAFVASYIAEAKQAGTWNPSVDSITGLIEKVARTFTLDNGVFEDRLPELDSNERAGILEEFYAGLIPASGRIDDGSSDELAPARPVFDQPSYSYPLVDATTGKPGIRFKVTTDMEWFERYLNTGDEAYIVNYIIKKMYDSFYQFKYQAKRQLLGNFINKAIDAQAGVTYTQNVTILKAGTIYKESSKFYIMLKNYDSAVNKSLATLASTDNEAVEIVPDLVKAIDKPIDEATGVAFIEEVKNSVEKLTIDATEGTSLSGSTIGAPVSSLRLYVKPGVMNSLDVNTLAGAFNVDKLALPAIVKTLPDFGNIDDSGVFAVLVDERGAKLSQNYLVANSTPVNGSLYINHFLHYGSTAFISKHTAIKVFTATGA